ncbi:MAG: hypothetical protein ACKO7R_03160, partial [Pseudanabaena sp.]
AIFTILRVRRIDVELTSKKKSQNEVLTLLFFEAIETLNGLRKSTTSCFHKPQKSTNDLGLL